jgi:IS30 family transposase
VKAKLEDTWSPQQISAWLRSEYPRRLDWHICHETIYQALYLGRKGGLTRALTAKLRTGRPLRKRWYSHSPPWSPWLQPGGLARYWARNRTLICGR